MPTANPLRNAYFRDLHIHTRNSFEAYIFNVRRTADDAYRFAKGETVPHPSGFDMTIAGGPLDFYAVTDHAEYLGILPAMDTLATALSELPWAEATFSDDPDAILNAFQGVGVPVSRGEPFEEIYHLETIHLVWAANVLAANEHGEPGVFTTFAAYGYTSVTNGCDDGTFGDENLHRNVFFRDDAPFRAFSTLDSSNPEDLGLGWTASAHEVRPAVVMIVEREPGVFETGWKQPVRDGRRLRSTLVFPEACRASDTNQTLVAGAVIDRFE